MKTPASNGTKPRQFRLKEETLLELDQVASFLHVETGVDATRSDAIRYCAKKISEKIRTKSSKTA